MKAKMTKAKLAATKRECMEFNERWVANGGTLTEWGCFHCGKQNTRPRPAKKDVGPKGVWDSMSMCYECGAMSFLIIPVKGPCEVVMV